MCAETVRDFEALEAQAASILNCFTTRGFERVAPDIIQPADVFLDEVGESLRSRTYVFTSPGGEELCLRPDLTIPACRLYLDRHPDSVSVARYCYNGPAFRYQPGGATAARPREFRHAGVELFGATDEAKAEAEILSTVLEALESTGVANYTIRIGDLGLFFALLRSLNLPERWQQRLGHHFWRPAFFHKLIRQLCEKSTRAFPKDIRPLLDELDLEKPSAAEEQVALYLDERDIPMIGLRTLSEITERLIEIARDAKEEPLTVQSAELIENYLAISGPPKAAGARISDLASSAGIELNSALKTYNKRLETFNKAGIDLSNATFSAEFGRNLEYYTGFVFQIEMDDCGPSGHIAGGGRYDGLLERIGASNDISAVGAAIHTERLLAAAKGLLQSEENGDEA